MLIAFQIPHYFFLHRDFEFIIITIIIIIIIIIIIVFVIIIVIVIVIVIIIIIICIKFVRPCVHSCTVTARLSALWSSKTKNIFTNRFF